MRGATYKRRHSELSGETRARYGFLCTFENAAGERISAHRVGRLREQLPALLEAALALDPSYRLVSYSTPNTILSDLDGSRAAKPASGRMQRGRQAQALPERLVLGSVGRPELLHPRLDLPSRNDPQ